MLMLSVQSFLKSNSTQTITPSLSTMILIIYIYYSYIYVFKNSMMIFLLLLNCRVTKTKPSVLVSDKASTTDTCCTTLEHLPTNLSDRIHVTV